MNGADASQDQTRRQTTGGANPSVSASPHLFPLDEFYARMGLAMPLIEVIAGELIPEPQRALLVHNLDMTPTLEDFYQSDIHLEILSREQRGDYYFREVVLRLNRDNQPVEFGANKITLNRFAPEVQRLILEEQIPLGHILKVHGVPHTSRPQAYLKVQPDPFMARSLESTPGACLYGRRNTLRDPAGQPISEIVEILPARGGLRPHSASPA